MGDVLMAFTSLFQGGLFERFPELKIAVVETGSGWLPYWLDRMDGFLRQDRLHHASQDAPLRVFQAPMLDRL